MATFGIAKVAVSLPEVLEPNVIYLVRIKEGFDLLCTDATGSFAHKLNQPTRLYGGSASSVFSADRTFHGGTANG